MSENSERLHQPVMLEETLLRLAPRPGDWIADGTVGLGGHAAEILRRLEGEGLLIGIDRDVDALALAETRLQSAGGPFRLFHGDYTRLGEFIREAGRVPEGALDGLLLDLGVSSMQLDCPGRGFSLQRDGPLDMRMDPSCGESAADFLKRVSVEDLEHTFRTFGEERAARRVATAIDSYRKKKAIETTGQLSRIIESVVSRRGRKIHPATKCFMAIRLVVNRELEMLRRLLRDIDRYMRVGGRVLVLSYHSLEDRIAKQLLGARVEEGLCRWAFSGVGRPSAQEVARNPRARSARLRAVIRAGGS